ncbi:hypothetical protein OEZ86_003864 [Tetradesmus obliquus]|nr:hypothetical protein OEZ86_003864 [Tetradesmus obliquus]
MRGPHGGPIYRTTRAYTFDGPPGAGGPMGGGPPGPPGPWGIGGPHMGPPGGFVGPMGGRGGGRGPGWGGGGGPRGVPMPPWVLDSSLSHGIKRQLQFMYDVGVLAPLMLDVPCVQQLEKLTEGEAAYALDELGKVLADRVRLRNPGGFFIRICQRLRSSRREREAEGLGPDGMPVGDRPRDHPGRELPPGDRDRGRGQGHAGRDGSRPREREASRDRDRSGDRERERGAAVAPAPGNLEPLGALREALAAQAAAAAAAAAAGSAAAAAAAGGGTASAGPSSPGPYGPHGWRTASLARPAARGAAAGDSDGLSSRERSRDREAAALAAAAAAPPLAAAADSGGGGGGGGVPLSLQERERAREREREHQQQPLPRDRSPPMLGRELRDRDRERGGPPFERGGPPFWPGPPVTEVIKEMLKPVWKSGKLTREAFKAVAKKATDKVLGGIPPPGAPDAPPDSAEGAAAYLNEPRRVKIRALVDSYVSKYAHT